MTSKARIARGRKTQEIAAQFYRDNGQPDARAVAASLPGKDILNVMLTAPEVKTARDFDMLKAMRQAKRNAEEGELPYVIYRPDGYGPERVAEWPVIMTFEEVIRLQREAGYW